MGAPDGFNIESALNDWIKYNCSAENMTPADTRDMKEHILYTVQELVDEKDLSEEEAFAVAKIRFGGKEDWADEMQTVNEKNFQLKKIIILFSGFFLFLFANYFVLCLDKILFLTLNNINGVTEANVEVVKYLIRVFYLLTVFFFVAAFFMHEPLNWILNRLKIRPLFVIFFVLAIFILVILEWYLIIKISHSVKDVLLRNSFYVLERDFKNYFLLISGLGYIILFLRYYKKFIK